MVDRIVSRNADEGTRAEVRALLTSWRDNNAKLQVLQTPSFLLKEVMPLSQELSAVAASGLAALDFIDKRTAAPQSWSNEQSSILQAAAKPKAQLLLMVVEPVRKLADAAARGVSPAAANSR
jgi:hypothetical protein